jgi:hypothetical protein
MARRTGTRHMRPLQDRAAETLGQARAAETLPRLPEHQDLPRQHPRCVCALSTRPLRACFFIEMQLYITAYLTATSLIKFLSVIEYSARSTLSLSPIATSCHFKVRTRHLKPVYHHWAFHWWCTADSSRVPNACMDNNCPANKRMPLMQGGPSSSGPSGGQGGSTPGPNPGGIHQRHSGELISTSSTAKLCTYLLKHVLSAVHSCKRMGRLKNSDSGTPGHGAGGGTPGGPPGGPPGGGGGGGGGGGPLGRTPKDKDKDGKEPPKTPGKAGKKVPSSFVEVIDTLVDLLFRFDGPRERRKDADSTAGALPYATTSVSLQPSSRLLPGQGRAVIF